MACRTISTSMSGPGVGLCGLFLRAAHRAAHFLPAPSLEPAVRLCEALARGQRARVLAFGEPAHQEQRGRRYAWRPSLHEIRQTRAAHVRILLFTQAVLEPAYHGQVILGFLAIQTDHAFDG